VRYVWVAVGLGIAAAVAVTNAVIWEMDPREPSAWFMTALEVGPVLLLTATAACGRGWYGLPAVVATVLIAGGGLAVALNESARPHDVGRGLATLLAIVAEYVAAGVVVVGYVIGWGVWAAARRPERA
jgi:hypothetical protein